MTRKLILLSEKLNLMVKQAARQANISESEYIRKAIESTFTTQNKTKKQTNPLLKLAGIAKKAKGFQGSAGRLSKKIDDEIYG